MEKADRVTCKRSYTIILIKNIPYTVKEYELRELFGRYGSLVRFLISPFNTLAIAEYETPSQATAAMKNLAYHKVNFITPIYLEYAPLKFIKASSKAEEEDEASQEDVNDEKEQIKN